MGELDPLGVAGGPGGVDQGRQVVGPDGAPGLFEVEAVRGMPPEVGEADERLGTVVAAVRTVVDGAVDDDVFDGGRRRASENVDELGIGDDDAVARVLEQVADLLGAEVR